MHPSSSYMNNRICTELANRGYRALCADNPFSFNGNGYKGYEDHAAIIARGINCLKGQTPPGQASSPCPSITGITKVVIIGHSMAGPMMAFYQNIAENGPSACQKPERIIPCDPTNLSNLPKADGMILLDSHLGDAVATMTYTDPAMVREDQPGLRNPDVDMFDPKNGFTATTNAPPYSDKFRKEFLQPNPSGITSLSTRRCKRCRTSPMAHPIFTATICRSSCLAPLELGSGSATSAC